MVERADGQARPPRQFPDLQGVKRHGNLPRRRPRDLWPRPKDTTSRYVRFKGKIGKKWNSRKECSARRTSGRRSKRQWTTDTSDQTDSHGSDRTPNCFCPIRGNPSDPWYPWSIASSFSPSSGRGGERDRTRGRRPAAVKRLTGIAAQSTLS